MLVLVYIFKTTSGESCHPERTAPTTTKVEGWVGYLVFGWVGRMWACLEGSSDIYQVMLLRLREVGLDRVRTGNSPKNAFPKRVQTRERGWIGRWR